VVKVGVASGVTLWREKLSPLEQKGLLDDVVERLKSAPLYRPVMPGTAKPFSAEQSNFGPLGWVSDKSGYRYQPVHPMTGTPWPAIPAVLLALWEQVARLPPPQCCLVNFYRDDAKMGLHQDRDEGDVGAPVIGVSLGDTAVFRIGGPVRGGKTVRVALASGDVIAFGGPARLAYHGIDRIQPGTSRLVAGGGRLSLTLRHVTS
jgi:alkylated DNA repair protein (DNA oxidative demethylase)